MEPDALRRKASAWTAMWLGERNWFAKAGDPPGTERLSMMGPHLDAGTLTFEFECSKKLYKSAQDPEVQAMIKEVMDAAYAKFPELANHKVKIEAYRKGENILDDTSMDDDLDMPPSDDE